jgi:RNA polymerase sigma-70 factor (ECF subfamily)
MDVEQSLNRLSHIVTLWSLVKEAHAPGTSEHIHAQEALVRRYGGAVHRYLLGALRDPHAADELFQEFSLRIIRGDFHRADPEKGRFRDFVKTSLFHLIVDHQKREKRKPRQFAPEAPEVADHSAPPDLDHAFLQSWREELLDRAWLALSEHSKEHGQPFYDVLRFRAENPGCTSTQMAEQLSLKLGRKLTADGVRQSLHRAREKYADVLLDEVEASLDRPSHERLEQELIDLELLSYCRSALERRGSRSSS